MKKSYWMSVVLASALAGFPLLTACGADAGEEQPVSTGTISMALGTTTNGTEYRLSNAVFDIDGPSPTTLSSTDDPSEAVLTAVLASGAYTSTLADGWRLQRNDGGTFVDVQATLVSNNPVAFQISGGATTRVGYRFDTDGTIINIGHGTLEVGIAVNEVGTCEPFGPGCAAGEWCVAGDILGSPDNVCAPIGPLAVGDDCDGSVACVENALCGDIDGTGNRCLELCPASEVGAPCSGGGGVCNDVGSPTTGICL